MMKSIFLKKINEIFVDFNNIFNYSFLINIPVKKNQLINKKKYIYTLTGKKFRKNDILCFQ